MDPRDAEAGGQDLRERRQVDDVPLLVEGLDGAQRGWVDTVEVEFSIGVILEDEQVLADCKVVQVPPPVLGPDRPGRVLEVRDGIDELAGPALESRLPDEPRQVVNVHAPGVAVHGEELGSQVLERCHGADIAGLLDEDRVSGVEEHPRDKVQALLGAACNQGLPRLGLDSPDLPVALADRCDQPGVAASHRVLEDLASFTVDQVVHDFAQPLVRECPGVRRAGGEGDHVGLVHQAGQLANERRAHDARVPRQKGGPVHHRRVSEHPGLSGSCVPAQLRGWYWS